MAFCAASFILQRNISVWSQSRNGYLQEVTSVLRRFPRYIVLYNASEMKEEKSILRLSDVYGIKGEASLKYLKGFSDCKQGQGGPG